MHHGAVPYQLQISANTIIRPSNISRNRFFEDIVLDTIQEVNQES